jgi:hypothetical protein
MNQHLIAFLASLAVLALGSTALGQGSEGERKSQELTTERRVQGIITQVEPTVVTITGSSKREVVGKIDPKRTKVTVNGRSALASALEVTYVARGEIGLDDVWCSIDAQAR